MNKKLCFLAGLGFLLMFPSAQAQVVMDQMQPVVDSTVGGIAVGGASEQELAQTLTVKVGGQLLGVFLPIACDSGRLLIEIRALDGNEPGAVVLRRRWVDAVNVPFIGPALRRFRIREGLSFATGDRFAVVLRNPTGSCGMFRGPEGDSYVGGEGFFQALPNPPGWVPFSDTETRLDLPFMTLMLLP